MPSGGMNFKAINTFWFVQREVDWLSAGCIWGRCSELFHWLHACDLDSEPSRSLKIIHCVLSEFLSFDCLHNKFVAFAEVETFERIWRLPVVGNPERVQLMKMCKYWQLAMQKSEGESWMNPISMRIVPRCITALAFPIHNLLVAFGKDLRR